MKFQFGIWEENVIEVNVSEWERDLTKLEEQ